MRSFSGSRRTFPATWSQLEVDCVRSAATGLNEDYPAQQWEVWNGAENRWDALEAPRTRRMGSTARRARSKTSGRPDVIEIAMPPRPDQAADDGKSAYWVRCRYTTALPPRGPEAAGPRRLPEVPGDSLASTRRVVGGTISASNCATVTAVTWGRATARRARCSRWAMRRSCRAAPAKRSSIGRAGSRRVRKWRSGPKSRTLPTAGRTTGILSATPTPAQILFGPEIIQPDGCAAPVWQSPAQRPDYCRLRHTGTAAGRAATSRPGRRRC